MRRLSDRTCVILETILLIATGSLATSSPSMVCLTYSRVLDAFTAMTRPVQQEIHGVQPAIRLKGLYRPGEDSNNNLVLRKRSPFSESVLMGNISCVLHLLYEAPF